MKRIMLMASIAVAALAGLAAAQVQSPEDAPFTTFREGEDHRVSDLMGATVYVTEAEIPMTEVDVEPDGWEAVARVDDFVMTRMGEVRGVLIDVGGFLGIGARTVMVAMDQLRFVDHVDREEVYVVFTATREQLEGAPEYDRTSAEAGVDPAPVGSGDTAADPAPVGGVDRAPRPEDDRLGLADPQAGFAPVERGVLTVDDLTSAVVYDRFDERVSDISDVLLSADGGQVVGVLIDIGGFFGLGARSVAVDIDDLDVLYSAERDETRVYLALTEEELENLPEYRP
jgi:hypothetical protein